MEERSWAKSDGESTVVVEHKLIDGKEQYTINVLPSNSIFGLLWIESRSQLQLLIDTLQTLQDVLNDGDA